MGESIPTIVPRRWHVFNRNRRGPITAEGVQQARDVAANMKTLNFGIVVASPYLRCVQTAVPWWELFKEGSFQVKNAGRYKLRLVIPTTQADKQPARTLTGQRCQRNRTRGHNANGVLLPRKVS